MLKRTFIPPSHRPYVRGSPTLPTEKTMSSEEFFDLIQNERTRRKLIFSLLKGKSSIDLPEWCQQVLTEIFPHVREK